MALPIGVPAASRAVIRRSRIINGDYLFGYAQRVLRIRRYCWLLTAGFLEIRQANMNDFNALLAVKSKRPICRPPPYTNNY
jgi:hypothetical protein